jgi:hypothetical protein
MTKEVDRYKHSRRIHRKLAHIERQMGIRRAHSFPDYGTPGAPAHESPHRYHKVSGLTCGSSTCAMCGNPRKFFNERTMQEKRQMQDVDRLRDRHSNGVIPQDE